MSWGYTPVFETWESYFYIPTNIINPEKNVAALSKISSEIWLDTVKSGISKYGKV